MDIHYFMVALIFNTFIRKNILGKENTSHWGVIVKVFSFLIPAMFGLSFILGKSQILVVHTVCYVFLLTLVIILKETYENTLSKILLKALLPFVVIGIIGDVCKLLLPEFYKANDNYFNLANLASICWMVAFGIGANSQLKEINKQELKNKVIIDENEVLDSLVKARTSEIELQKKEIENTLQELKATQVQLIQQEKLASLGELTAGIAHEIQNPLNFVNNFSELNLELFQEMNEEQSKEKPDIELIKELESDIISNLKKINEHGNRASRIVKGMLMHSRSSNGQKELTDINAIADEYLRLAYHGLRAKDKSFNAAFKTNFDEHLPQIMTVAQDVGRVLLNLINNAFQSPLAKGQIIKEVIVTTKFLKVLNGKDLVQIRVKDNGSGIKDELKQKIFQPFFTTKESGKGTGLGLSLAYDIIIKGHGGTIEFESEENNGTEFIVSIPV